MRPTALEIIKAVAVRYGVTLEDLRSHSRVARLATARAVVCYLLYRYYNYSLMDVRRIRRRFKDRDEALAWLGIYK